MQYPWIDEYLLSLRGVTKDFQPEWNWVRYHIGGKMFAAVCRIWIQVCLLLSSAPERPVPTESGWAEILHMSFQNAAALWSPALRRGLMPRRPKVHLPPAASVWGCWARRLLMQKTALLSASAAGVL